MAAQRRSSLGEAAFGVCLQMGYGGPQDTKAAEQQFQSSDKDGNPFGQWLFALLAPEDEQKDKEHREALAAAAEKFAPAANTAAFDGYTTPETELPKGRGAEISRLLQLSVGAGDIAGMNNLAVWRGDGLREFESSVSLYKKATEAKGRMLLWPGLTIQPAAYPNYNLGRAYQFGFGAPQSDAEAFRRYSQASALGHSTASEMLALMCERGQAVPASRARAISLYRKAAAGGNYYSRERLRALNYGP
jgi:TPR repeat protein